MNLYSVRIVSLLTVLIVLAGWQPKAHAEVLISNVLLTETTLSFDVNGTIDVVGNFNKGLLYVGEPGNTSWVDAFTDGTWTDAGGSFTPFDFIVNSLGDGDIGVIVASSDAGVGDTIAGTASVSGTFNPGSTDISNWIISAGFSVPTPAQLPDPNTATGGVVPEPSTGLLLLGLFGATTLRRRKRL